MTSVVRLVEVSFNFNNNLKKVKFRKVNTLKLIMFLINQVFKMA